MSEIFDYTNTLLLVSIANISLSESCLNEGWTDLTKRKSTHVTQKQSSFARMLLLHKLQLQLQLHYIARSYSYEYNNNYNYNYTTLHNTSWRRWHASHVGETLMGESSGK